MQKKSYRIAALSFLLAFVMLLLVVPSVSAMSAISDQYEAGYFITTKCDLNTAGCPGSLLSFHATWNIPTVTCTESGELFILLLGVAYGYGSNSAGSELEVYCTGTTPSYSLGYNLAAGGGTTNTVSPGDKIETIGNVIPSTGYYSVVIKDMGPTNVWTKGPVATTKPLVTSNGGAVFLFCGTPAFGGCASSVTIPLPKFTTIKFTNVKFTMLGHTGSLGSFLSISKISTTKEIWVNLAINGGTGDTVAKPSSITSTSTGFSIIWVKGL